MSCWYGTGGHSCWIPQYKTVFGLVNLLTDAGDRKCVCLGSDDNCQSAKLGWFLDSLNPGDLASAEEVIAHQHSEIEGDSSCSATLVVGPPCKGIIGQCHGSGIHKGAPRSWVAQEEMDFILSWE